MSCIKWSTLQLILVRNYPSRPSGKHVMHLMHLHANLGLGKSKMIHTIIIACWRNSSKTLCNSSKNCVNCEWTWDQNFCLFKSFRYLNMLKSWTSYAHGYLINHYLIKHNSSIVQRFESTIVTAMLSSFVCNVQKAYGQTKGKTRVKYFHKN